MDLILKIQVSSHPNLLKILSEKSRNVLIDNSKLSLITLPLTQDYHQMLLVTFNYNHKVMISNNTLFVTKLSISLTTLVWLKLNINKISMFQEDVLIELVYSVGTIKDATPSPLKLELLKKKTKNHSTKLNLFNNSIKIKDSLQLPEEEYQIVLNYQV
jgi:hypothetical protein